MMFKLMKPLALILLMLSITQLSMAKDIGTYGITYPIAEQDAINTIYQRLVKLQESGELDKMNAEFKDRVIKHSYRPKPLALSSIDKTNTFYYAPIAVAPKDITDLDGNIIAKAGTTVNALTRLIFYQSHWLFFNGDDKRQVCFAIKTIHKDSLVKLIATGGDVRELEKRLHRTIYFDQAGRITTKLNINHVPAEVTRAGNQLRITEYAKADIGGEGLCDET